MGAGVGQQGQWRGSGWMGRVLPGGIASLLMVLVACGTEAPPRTTSATLLSIDAGLLAPHEPFEARLVDEDSTSEVELTWGTLPRGIDLADGVLRGTPTLAGEHRRFEVTLRDSRSAPRERRVYSLSIGLGGPLTQLISGVEAQGDTVQILRNFGRPIDESFVFDSALNLAWPLRAGTIVQGSALASPRGGLDFIARGVAWQGGFSIPYGEWEPRTRTVWQLFWESEEPIDFDLHLVPHSATGLSTVDVNAPLREREGVWLARHVIQSDKDKQGVEAIVTSSDLAPGHYALVALRVGGDGSHANLWLAARDDQGERLAEDRLEAFVSDISSGSLEADLAEHRQSWRALGHITVDDGGTVQWEAPDRGKLFPIDAEW